MSASDPETPGRRPSASGGPDARADRLKAALQANIARRKTQARARAAAAGPAQAQAGPAKAGQAPAAGQRPAGQDQESRQDE